MRVTQSMLTNQSLSDLNNNLGRIKVLEEKLSSEKRINHLSDDPVALSFALRYKEDLKQNEQFSKNISYAKSKIVHTESAISEVDTILQRARKLTVQGATGSNSAESRATIAAEIKQLYNQLVDVSNTQFNGDYIFNGQLTNIKPYDYSDAKDAQVNSDTIKLEIGKGVALGVNVTGTELFGQPGDITNAFQVLNDLEDGLRNDNQEQISEALANIDGSIDRVIDAYAKVGAISKRADLITTRLETEHVNLKKLISNTEDIDLAEIVTDLSAANNVYQASLNATAKIIQTTLVDFLR